MASTVTSDGNVVPPSNIAHPGPTMDLKNFKWDTVDNKILGPQPGRDNQHQNGIHVQKTAVDSVLRDGSLFHHEQPKTVEEEDAEANKAQLGHQLAAQPGAPQPPLFPINHFQGAFAGNGFNLIFRPQPKNDTTIFPVSPVGPNDNILELNLTTEQLTFGNTIGSIPNRGLSFNEQPDIFLTGFPYLQTIQDVTNLATGRGDNPEATGIHFETGMWLNVPETTIDPVNPPSIVRMGTIPHGTTINAQALSPVHANTTSGGVAGGPDFDSPGNVIDTTPFQLNDPTKRVVGVFPSQIAENNNTFRIPQDLSSFIKAGTITTDIMKNPNLILKTAISGQNITETIVFEVSTGPPSATLNGGGTANISFLAGKQAVGTTSAPLNSDTPNAHAAFMRAKFWIETVAYAVEVPRLTTKNPILLKPTMPAGSTAPTPVFEVIPPAKLPCEAKSIIIPGIQIQYSQTVNLNFGAVGGQLTWPHVSVATLVPAGPQGFQMA